MRIARGTLRSPMPTSRRGVRHSPSDLPALSAMARQARSHPLSSQWRGPRRRIAQAVSVFSFSTYSFAMFAGHAPFVSFSRLNRRNSLATPYDRCRLGPRKHARLRSPWRHPPLPCTVIVARRRPQRQRFIRPRAGSRSTIAHFCTPGNQSNTLPTDDRSPRMPNAIP